MKTQLIVLGESLTSLNLFRRTGVGGASKDRLHNERKVLEEAIAVENLSGAVFFI